MNTVVVHLFYFILYGLTWCTGMEVTVTGASNGPIRLYAQLLPADEDPLCSLITPNYEGCKKMKLLEAPFAPSLDHPYYSDYRMIFVKDAGIKRATKRMEDKKAGSVQVRVKPLAGQEYIGWDIDHRNKRTQDIVKEMKGSELSDIMFVTQKVTSYTLCFARITFPGDHDYNDEDTFTLDLELIHENTELSWAMVVDGVQPEKARLNPIRSIAHFYLTTMMVGHPKSCLNFYHTSNGTLESGPYVLEIRPVDGILVSLIPLLDHLMSSYSNVLPTGNAINRIRISPSKKGEALVRLYSTTDFNPDELDKMFQSLDDTSVGYVSHHSTAKSSKIYYVRLSAEQNFCLVCYLKGSKKSPKTSLAYGFSVPVKSYEMLTELIDAGLQKPGVVALKFQTYNSHGGYEMMSKVEVKGGLRALGEILKALVAVVFYKDMVGVSNDVQSIGFELDQEGQAFIEIVFSNRSIETRGAEVMADAMNRSILELKDAINSLSSANYFQLTDSTAPDASVTPPMPQVDVSGVSAFAGYRNTATFLAPDYWTQLTKRQLRYSNECFAGDKFLILSLGIDFPETFSYKIKSVETASKTYMSQVMHYLSEKSFIIVEMPEDDLDRCTMTVCSLAEDGDRQLTILNKSYANTSDQLRLVLPWIASGILNYCPSDETSIEAVFEFYDQSNLNVFMYFLADFVPNIASAQILQNPKVTTISIVSEDASIEMAREWLRTSGSLVVAMGSNKYAVLVEPSYSLTFFDRKPISFVNIERLLLEKSKCQAPKSGMIPVKLIRNHMDGDLEAKVELGEWRFDKQKFNSLIRVFLKTLLIDGPPELRAAFAEIRFVPSQVNFKVKVLMSKKLCGSKSPAFFRDIVEQSVNGTKPANTKSKKKRQARKKGSRAASQKPEETVEENNNAVAVAVPEEVILEETKSKEDALNPLSDPDIVPEMIDIEPRQQVFITLLANTLELNLYGVSVTENYESDLLDAALSFSPPLHCPFQATFGDHSEAIYDWEGFGTAIASMLHMFREAPIGPFEVSPSVIPKVENTLTLERDFSLGDIEALLSAFDQMAYHMLVNPYVHIVGILKKSEAIGTLFVALDTHLFVTKDEAYHFNPSIEFNLSNV